MQSFRWRFKLCTESLCLNKCINISLGFNIYLQSEDIFVFVIYAKF